MSDNKVKCNSCGTEYKAIFFETNQGENCSSEVYFETNNIHSSYGSKHDFCLFEFVNGEVPDWVESGLICDECVDKLIDAEQVKITRRDAW